MMNAAAEEAAIRRTQTLAQARKLCKAWGYWCAHGLWGEKAGRKPFVHGVVGGPERRYQAPPQWYPAEPRWPEADENTGLAVQKAYIHLPERPYRLILRVEFCSRPFIVPLKEGEVEYLSARWARVSQGAYGVTLERALLALANVMKHKNLWVGA